MSEKATITAASASATATAAEQAANAPAPATPSTGTTAKKVGFAFVFPVILMIVVNVAYNIVAKLTPVDVNALASVFLTYLVCCVSSFAFFFITSKDRNYPRALKACNWSAPAMGLSLVLMEVAILLQYRAGWDISIACLVLYVILAVCLLVIGAIFYKEKVGIRRIVGCAVCAVGLVLVMMF